MYFAVLYAEQLLSQGHGLPLWLPELSSGADSQAHIGDVGCVYLGGFRRFFNVMRPADDPLNKDGVPDGFVPLAYDENLTSHLDMPPGALYNGHSTPGDATKASEKTDRVPVGRYSFEYKSNGDSAVAVLARPGRHSKVVDNQALQAYMARYHDSWCHYVRCRITVPPEDVILVYGRTSTSQWSLATSSHNPIVIDVLKHGWSRPSDDPYKSNGQRDGPRNSQDEAECIFLMYHKLRNRYVQSMSHSTSCERLASEISTWIPEDQEYDTTNYVPGVGEEAEVFTDFGRGDYDRSLNDLADYILANSNAERAIVSHDDLYTIFKDCDPFLWPTDIQEFLESQQVPVSIDDSQGRTVGRLDLGPSPAPMPPRIPQDMTTLPYAPPETWWQTALVSPLRYILSWSPNSILETMLLPNILKATLSPNILETMLTSTGQKPLEDTQDSVEFVSVSSRLGTRLSIEDRPISEAEGEVVD